MHRNLIGSLVFLYSKYGHNGNHSFSNFLLFLYEVNGISCNSIPENIEQNNPNSVHACAESQNALRERLRAAGFLHEFSDSEEWNRVSWTRKVVYE